MEYLNLDKIFEAIYDLQDSKIPNFKMFLNGKWVSLEQRIEVRTPIDGSLIATIPSASEQEAGQAVDSAYANRMAIRTIPAVEKIEIFRRAPNSFSRTKILSSLC